MISARHVSAIVLALGLAACGSAEHRPTTYGTADTGYGYGVQYGRVSAIEQVREDGGSGVAGALIGGAVGGLAGHQIGSGKGQDAATVAGALGGAVAGHEIQKRMNDEHYRYRVTVTTDSGATRSFEQESIADLRVGDRVVIENDRIRRY